MDTLELTRRFLNEHYGIDPETVTPDAPLERFGIDSLMFVELVFEFESKMGMAIPMEELTKPNTIGELIVLVDKMREKQ